MGKNLLFIILFFGLISCQDEVKFNNPAIQAIKNNGIWRASLIIAVQYPDGSLMIEANQKNEILTFNTISATPQIYTVGLNTSNKAMFTQKNNNTTTTFSTGINSGEGQIVITEYDTVNSTITGTFQFNAKNDSTDPFADSTINFQQGVFYKVPVTISLKQ